jgi:aspartate/methionine/tyrosine aminotransferase
MAGFRRSRRDDVGSSEGIDFVLTALADPGDEVLVPLPTYPLYTAILHKIGAREVYYRTDPANGWQPDPKEVRSLVTPRTKAIVTTIQIIRLEHRTRCRFAASC